MGLEELSCFIQRVSNLLLLVFLLLNDCIESLTSAFLLHTLFILILDLCKLLLLLFKVGLSLVTLLVPFTHLLIIGLQSTRILFVSVLIASEEILLCCLVGCFNPEILLVQFVNCPLQLSHFLIMTLLGVVPKLLAILNQLLLAAVLLSSQIGASLLKVLDVNP